MRHHRVGKKFNRDTKERKALFRSLIRAVILYEKITTTLAKAKAVRRIAEKLVTYAKNGSSATETKLASFLQQKAVIEKLTKDITPRFKDRIGGYLRIFRTGVRGGDNAEKVVLEWSVVKEQKKKKETQTIEKKEKTPKQKDLKKK